MASKDCFDVLIVGGGPAGLSAALILGRSRRATLILDDGGKRNEAVLQQHAVLGADGFKRAEFLAQAREQVLAYPTVEHHRLRVERIEVVPDNGTPGGDRDSVLSTSSSSSSSPSSTSDSGSQMVCNKTRYFQAITTDGARWRGRKLVLATGVEDLVPEVDGFKELFGRGIYVCLHCEGYEYSGEPLGAYGNGERGVHIALEMLLWSRDVTLLTDGEELQATAKEWQLLKQHGIRVVTAKLVRAYAGADDQLAGVELAGGQTLPLRAIFFNTARRQRSALPKLMGLQLDEREDIICDPSCGRVPAIHGVFVAGNNSQAPLQLIMTAASQGAIVGDAVNLELVSEDMGLGEFEGK